MKTPQLLRLFCACLLVGASTAGSAAMRSRELLDDGWKFSLGDFPGAEQRGFDASAWRDVDLPHDWSIEGPYDENAPGGGPGGYLPTGTGWYRKTFTALESWAGGRVEILFDGVYQHSTVWLNGRELGRRPFGYISFHYDLTPHLKFGGAENELVVRVDNSRQPSSRWYSGSGIYRHVWLIATDRLHVPVWGTFVTTTDASAERATVSSRTTVRNDRDKAEDVELVCELLDESGNAVASASESRQIPPGESGEFAQELNVASPRLWSMDTPNLYRVRATVRTGGTVVDVYETVTGIRTLQYDRDRGLLMNGTPVKLRGMCVHHDGGGVGAAVPEGVIERRLRLLKEMGCNAVRASHNPMAPEFYELCDRIGLAVMDEIFDEWIVRKPQIQSGYSDVFAEWHERDVVDFVHRDRNHPSIVMWSAGNEIGEQWAENGPALLRELVEIFHREDPTRPVTAGMDNIFNQNGQAPVAFSELLDVVGYNYVDRWGTRRETHYSDDRVHFPERRFVGTEITTASGTRGEYRFGGMIGGGFARGQFTPGMGPEGALYVGQAMRAASLWRFTATRDFVIGDFGWTGFDYLGEARWPRKGAGSGPLDTCGFKKDTFYFYQSIWTAEPMLHLLPHWNWPDRVGKVVPVVAYSNCMAVELFLNGRSLGAKAREFPAQGAAGGWNSYAKPVIRATTSDMQLVWDVPYEPGELKAVGYDREGKVVANAVVRTAGQPATLEVTVDRTTLAADARDVAHVTVRALDANGVFVPMAKYGLTFELSGPARLIAVDNGDLTSHESYKTNTRALYNGMALAIVQSTREPGTTRVVVRSAGLPDATVAITTELKQ